MADNSTVQPQAKTPKPVPPAFSKCSNCNVPYTSSTSSLLLVCLHSFCQACIKRGALIAENGERENLVKCTKCKCNSNKADCGINLLSLTATSTSARFANKTPRCTCDGAPECSAICKECNEPLCSECIIAHRRVNLTKHHQILTLKELGELETIAHTEKISCPKHKQPNGERVLLDRYCDQCLKVSCSLCHEIGNEHYKHEYTSVDAAAGLFKNNLASQLKNLREKEVTVNRALSVIIEKMSDIEEAENKALEEVKEYYNKIMEAFRTRLNDLGSDIRKLASYKRDTLNAMKDDVKSLQSRLMETIQAVDYVADRGNPVAVLSVKKGLAHHMSTLLKLKCQVPNPSHKLNIQLQTDSRLVSQIIPNTGQIWVDGVLHDTKPQSASIQPVVSTDTSTEPMQADTTRLMGFAPSLSPSDQFIQSPLKLTARKTGCPADQYSGLTTSARKTMMPSTAARKTIPLLAQARKTMPASLQSAYKSRHKNTPQRVVPVITDRSAYQKPMLLFPTTLGSDVYESNRPLGQATNNLLNVKDETMSPPRSEVNGAQPLDMMVINDDPYTQDDKPRISPLRISKVTSLNDQSNGTSYKLTNGSASSGETTPPLNIFNKRKKTILSPHHIAKNHRPGDPNEDYCAVCHNGGELLICCDTCPKVYHAHCHVPELSGTASEFSCTLCFDEANDPEMIERQSYPPGVKRKAPSGLSDFEIRLCEKILLQLYCHNRSFAFHYPVPKTVKHYSSLIKNPMDLSTIKTKLRRQHFNHYDSIREFVSDIVLMFSNCHAFNGPLSDYTESARLLQQKFVSEISKYFNEYKSLSVMILPADQVMNIKLHNKLLVPPSQLGQSQFVTSSPSSMSS